MFSLQSPPAQTILQTALLVLMIMLLVLSFCGSEATEVRSNAEYGTRVFFSVFIGSLATFYSLDFGSSAGKPAREENQPLFRENRCTLKAFEFFPIQFANNK
jgi:ABC-type antimicrobial peptide transport system permease subunit